MGESSAADQADAGADEPNGHEQVAGDGAEGEKARFDVDGNGQTFEGTIGDGGGGDSAKGGKGTGRGVRDVGSRPSVPR
ncbi:MAG: hypothetical protein NTX73_14755 [Rhodobacterales bacterium]|nr:hypothetical protein [Rhodobacterales bacterium]